MKTLVLVEHDGVADQGRDPRRGHRRRRSSAKSICWSPARASAAIADAAAKIAGVGKVHVADGAHLEHQLAEDVAPVAAALMASHDAFLAPATTTGKNVAPRVAALLDVMQISRHPVGRGRGHLHPPDLRRQRHRHRQVEGRQEGHHRSRHGIREGRDAAAARARSKRSMPAARRASRASSAPSCRKSERPELTSAKVIVSGGRAFGSNDQFHGAARSAGRQARRRGRRHRAPRSMPAMRPTTIRSARPARSSRPKSISRSAFRARSSTSRA